MAATSVARSEFKAPPPTSACSPSRPSLFGNTWTARAPKRSKSSRSTVGIWFKPDSCRPRIEASLKGASTFGKSRFMNGVSSNNRNQACTGRRLRRTASTIEVDEL